MKKKLFIIIVSIALHATIALAQIPRTLSYQGMLTDADGKPKADGSYSFTFKLYDSTNAPTPIWEETKTLQVSKGLFSTSLGDVTPFGTTVKFDKQYWLGIKVGSEVELMPRIVLNSVAYCLNASLADTTWVRNGNDIYFKNGKVGIGTLYPDYKLHVAEGNLKVENLPGEQTKLIIGNQNTGNTYLGISTTSYSGGEIRLQAISKEGTKWGDILINPNGGDVNLGRNLLWAGSVLSTDQNGSIELGGNNISSGGGTPFIDFHSTGGDPDYNVRIINDANGQLSFYAQKVRTTGRTITSVLEITGGSDLAEPFDISHNEMLEPGSVVIIDDDNPGKLRLSSEPYDKRVAGVVSGAGGVQPGLTLKQEGVMEGNQNIALTGRVYVLATNENGSIKPGDRLTTSNIPGYSMKATDDALCSGSVIGKAMTPLTDDKGLVLVLINLQ